MSLPKYIDEKTLLLVNVEPNVIHSLKHFGLLPINTDYIDLIADPNVINIYNKLKDDADFDEQGRLIKYRPVMHDKDEKNVIPPTVFTHHDNGEVTGKVEMGYGVLIEMRFDCNGRCIQEKRYGSNDRVGKVLMSTEYAPDGVNIGKVIQHPHRTVETGTDPMTIGFEPVKGAQDVVSIMEYDGLGRMVKSSSCHTETTFTYLDEYTYPIEVITRYESKEVLSHIRTQLDEMGYPVKKENVLTEEVETYRNTYMDGVLVSQEIDNMIVFDATLYHQKLKQES